VGKSALRRAQPLDGAVDFAPLPLEVADLGRNLLRIPLFEIRRPLAPDQVLDFGQGEAEGSFSSGRGQRPGRSVRCPRGAAR
jgi:hypothetical protein